MITNISISGAEAPDSSNGWLNYTRKAVTANGWRCIPVRHNGIPYSYGNGQQYAVNDPVWLAANQDIFAVALDNAVLLDFDGNKPGTISESQLRELVGDLPKPHQVREADNSKHWLFSIPLGFDARQYKQSADGQLATGVDIKRGNQLMYIKHGKVLPYGGALPPRSTLTVAPEALILVLEKPVKQFTPLAPVTITDVTHPSGAQALRAACLAIAKAEEGTRNSTFNIEVMKIAQRVAGGEIAEVDAMRELVYAADCCGLEADEIQRTYNSAWKKGFSEPRRESRLDFDVIEEGNSLIAVVPDGAIGIGYIEKLKPSEAAQQALAQLGFTAYDSESKKLQRYVEGVWLPMAGDITNRYIASIYKASGVGYAPNRVNAISTSMTLEANAMQPPRRNVIGFVNGVFDLTTQMFEQHSPDNWLRNVNGIVYTVPVSGENLEQHAPAFYGWLNWVAAGTCGQVDAERIYRILAMFYMVLTNRYDWQLFIELTGAGGSGKGTAMQVCEMLAGDENCISMETGLLDTARGRAPCEGKTLITLPDQPQYTGNGNGLRAITGGDWVLIDQKHEPARRVLIKAVVVAANNNAMVFTERNGGIERRRVVFAFDRVVPESQRNAGLSAAIRTELPVIIRHLFATFPSESGAKAAKSALFAQRQSAEATAVKAETDPVAAFAVHLSFSPVADGIPIGGASVKLHEFGWNPSRSVYQAYGEFLADRGYRYPLSVQAFTKALCQEAKKQGAEYLTGKRQRDPNRKGDRNAYVTPTNIHYRESLAEFVDIYSDVTML